MGQDISKNSIEIIDDVEVCQKIDILHPDYMVKTTYTELKECDSLIVELFPDCPVVDNDTSTVHTKEIPMAEIFNSIKEDNQSLTVNRNLDGKIAVCNQSYCILMDGCGEDWKVFFYCSFNLISLK